MTPAQLASLERALGLSLPRGVRDVVLDGDTRSGPLSTDGPFVGLRPFLIWNLRYRDELRPAPWSRDYMAVGHDGCGNAFLIDVRRDAAPVYFYDHETGELSDLADSYAALLGGKTASVVERTDPALAPDTAAIARSEDVSESILNPIRLREWLAIIEADPQLSIAGERVAVNPYTRQEVRLATNGVAWWCGANEQGEIRLVWGALHWRRPGVEGIEKARALARSLGAKLFLGWEPA